MVRLTIQSVQKDDSKVSLSQQVLDGGEDNGLSQSMDEESPLERQGD